MRHWCWWYIVINIIIMYILYAAYAYLFNFIIKHAIKYEQ